MIGRLRARRAARRAARVMDRHRLIRDAAVVMSGDHLRDLLSHRNPGYSCGCSCGCDVATSLYGAVYRCWACEAASATAWVPSRAEARLLADRGKAG